MVWFDLQFKIFRKWYGLCKISWDSLGFSYLKGFSGMLGIFWGFFHEFLGFICIFIKKSWQLLGSFRILWDFQRFFGVLERILLDLCLGFSYLEGFLGMLGIFCGFPRILSVFWDDSRGFLNILVVWFDLEFSENDKDSLRFLGILLYFLGLLIKDSHI